MRTRAMLLATALMLMGSGAHAQSVMATATVPLAAPTGNGTRNLTFGVIAPLPGSTQSIDVPAAPAAAGGTQAGEFRYDVAGARGLSFTLAIPTQLTAPGAAALPLSFSGARYGGYCIVTGGGCTLTSFNPALLPVLQVCAQSVGGGSCHPSRVFADGSQLRVYVGGLLDVPPTARAGVYTGTITMTIVQVL